MAVPNRMVANLSQMLASPNAQAIQRLAAQLGGGAGNAQRMAALLGGGGGGQRLPMPVMAPPSGQVDTGYNPAGYQRAIGNTGQAAADWEAHHPGAMRQGNIPDWISAYMAHQVQSATPGPAPLVGNLDEQFSQPYNVPVDITHPFRAPGHGPTMDPHAVLQQVVDAHRAAQGLPAMHPEDLHGRVTALAHEILNGRSNRLKRSLRSIGRRPQVNPVPPGPATMPTYSSQ